MIGLVGAVLGAAVGFILASPSPTADLLVVADRCRGEQRAGAARPRNLDVPAARVGLVIGLPLLTAGVVGATTRSRRRW
jgi:hypothetical protein